MLSESNLRDAEFGRLPRRRGLQARAAAFSVIGASVGSVLLFTTGLSLWGLLVGLGLMVALAIGTALAANNPGALASLLTYLFAFSLLTWPLLLLAAGGLWATWE